METKESRPRRAQTDDARSRAICPGGVGFETRSATGGRGAVLVANQIGQEIITLSFTLFSTCYPLSPFCPRAAAETFDAPGGFQIAQPKPDHVPADAGAGAFQVGNAEFADGGFNGVFHQFGFRAAPGFHVAGTLLELAIGAAGDGEEMIQPREQVVFAVVPALGAFLQDMVVIFLRLFDEAFQADVAPDFVAVLVKREQGKETGHRPIAVAERMDAKEIENERADGNKRRDVILVNGVAIDQAEFVHGGGRGFGGNAFETDDGRGAGPKFDDFVVHFLELAGVTAAFLTKFMQTAQQVGGDWQIFRFRVDEIQRAAVAGDFLFGTVFGAGVAEDERAQTVGGDSDAFDAVGGFDALDERHFAQGFKHLRRLAGV